MLFSIFQSRYTLRHILVTEFQDMESCFITTLFNSSDSFTHFHFVCPRLCVCPFNTTVQNCCSKFSLYVLCVVCVCECVWVRVCELFCVVHSLPLPGVFVILPFEQQNLSSVFCCAVVVLRIFLERYSLLLSCDHFLLVLLRRHHRI